MKDDHAITEHEQCYLGSLILAAGRGKIDTRLQADDFLHKKHGHIFETIQKQSQSGITPTLQTLVSELSPNIPISDIAELTNKIPSDANLSFYEDQIFEASKTRNVLKSIKLAADEIEAHTDPDTVLKNLIPALASVTTARNEAGIKTSAELLKTQFPDISWIVPGLFGEGLTMICGAPKIGKSWLVLNLAIAAAAGGDFLGGLKANKTDTLYLALEDTDRRLHNRLKKLTAPQSDKLKITTQWRDGYIGLEYYLKANKGIGLVIIDTLARFANIEDMNDYSATTNAMARLKRIADDLKIAIILIHHAKKAGQNSDKTDWMEAVLGSTGLTGATDSTIFIERDRSKTETKNTAKLYATGRDAADIFFKLKLDLDCGGWTITDNIPAPKPQPKDMYTAEPEPSYGGYSESQYPGEKKPVQTQSAVNWTQGVGNG